MKTLGLLLTLGAAWLLTACGGGTTGSTPLSDVVLTASDGATAAFPPALDDQGAPAAAGGSFTKIADATGAVDDELKNVSATYELRLDAGTDLAGNVVVTVPLAAAFLPEGVDGAALQPLMDDGTGAWAGVGSLVVYDAATTTLAFAVNLRGKVEYAPPSETDEGVEALAGSLEGPVVRRFRIDSWLWTSAQRSYSASSNFRITWYPPELGKPYSAPSDAAWGNPSGTATDPVVPNFVEDFDAALNQAYTGLLGVPAAGGTLFAEPGILPLDAAVGPCGDGAGESPLGGPLKISNTRITGLHDLVGVTAHELAHVFQGQYYTRGTTGNLINWAFSGNRWFIEASANWLGADILGYTDAEKRVYWTKDGDSEYLSAGLTKADDNQMYTAAHFLDYLTGLYGRELVGEVMASSSNAAAALSRSLLDRSVAGGLSAAFRTYGQWLVTHPQDVAGMNGAILAKMAGYTAQYLPNTVLKETRTYVELIRPLAPLGMSYVEIKARNQGAAKLVAVLTKESAQVEPFTWGFFANDNASFVGKVPLDDPSKDSLAFADCGQGLPCNGLSRLLVNTDPVGATRVTDAFYLLLAPGGVVVDEGRVTWSPSSIGAIPERFLSGYTVYRDLGGGSYERLGSASYKPGGEQSYANASLSPTDTVLVQVEDVFGNVWPEVEEAANVELWLSCRGVQGGTMTWGCVRYLGPEIDVESIQFLDNATQQCLNATYEQYYALTFDDEQACRDWCSQAAGGDDVCATPGTDVTPVVHPACKGVEAGNDSCYQDSCYNCCGDCEGGAVLIYECMGGCYTSGGGPAGVLCECE